MKSTLTYFVDNEFIRGESCIDSAFTLFSKKHEMVTSDGHPIASLLLLYFHEKGFHSGRELILNLIRKNLRITNCETFEGKIITVVASNI